MSALGLTTISNYDFCTQWVIDNSDSKPVRVLDYGCGGGEIVKLLRAREVEAFGCDTFGGAAVYSELENSVLFGTAILKMEENKIPFPDNYFDFLVSNQVIEHVRELDKTLAEFQRVLKPGGQLLTIFPDKSTWREGHCDIPFLHWFPKKSTPRIYYTLLLRSLGMGSFKEGKSPMQWSQDTCIWLDEFTYYRTAAEIHSQYSAYFSDVRSIEAELLQKRLGDRYQKISWLPKSLQQSLTKKFAGRAIVARNL
ncbi:class I SAM-dependent methyltransferase [Chamaesiphon sp. GL140_3_metabinner_50]|uniref:class I SAM-dependent methyltransferase n=1 Tax=Chamaesiphon sp. GL140_3_metabinner_50 TaxID=2970812 RepID=UPI0025F4B3DE|nr:class I SAM-dependent methyltransferase [Chamaesiphon sp. GL140_3_metabinner_50]